jgi:hypothetical protein
MSFDIRIPIGAMFVLIGALLVAYGLSAGTVTVSGAHGHNVNAWWGSLMALFGVAMLGIARRARGD